VTVLRDLSRHTPVPKRIWCYAQIRGRIFDGHVLLKIGHQVSVSKIINGQTAIFDQLI